MRGAPPHDNITANAVTASSSSPHPLLSRRPMPALVTASATTSPPPLLPPSSLPLLLQPPPCRQHNKLHPGKEWCHGASAGARDVISNGTMVDIMPSPPPCLTCHMPPPNNMLIIASLFKPDTAALPPRQCCTRPTHARHCPGTPTMRNRCTNNSMAHPPPPLSLTSTDAPPPPQQHQHAVVEVARCYSFTHDDYLEGGGTILWCFWFCPLWCL